MLKCGGDHCPTGKVGLGTLLYREKVTFRSPGYSDIAYGMLLHAERAHSKGEGC